MLRSGRIEEYKEFSQFKSIKEFNTSMEMFLAEHKKEFTKSELVGLKRLVRYSAKYFGVANAKVATILKAINEKLQGFGISRRTFERMLNKAVSLGILTIKNTVRPKGGKGHNVYVFNKIDALKKEKLTHCENSETLTASKDEESKNTSETINLFKTNNIITINKRKEQRLDASFTASYVPKEFVQAVKPFFNCAKTIEDFWKSVHIDTFKVKGLIDNQTITYTAIDSFKQAIRSYKTGKIKTTPVRYFTGIFKKQMDKICFEELAVYKEI
ncbi:hypothetical protein H7S55_25615 [Priestia aryabhattai]|uniref:hypothetical protein n=1 Tax=Priestia aryabhattai TaxID=412384 RepID=UPI001C8EF45B|nr:hypothetical protein [Priestia aryabhattai]MBY0003523.1 hypothetical protein [Priestia aryabhattai]